MSGHLYIEQRSLKDANSLSWDLAHHVYGRPLRGKVVIVANEPAWLLASFSKQWYRVLRLVERERSSTLNASRILALTQKLASVTKVRFVAKAPTDDPLGDVFFATPEVLLDQPPACRTLYVTCRASRAQLEVMTRNMPRHSLVVLYT